MYVCMYVCILEWVKIHQGTVYMYVWIGLGILYVCITLGLNMYVCMYVCMYVLTDSSGYGTQRA